MGWRDVRLPVPVFILPSWLPRHQVELVNGDVQVSGTHRARLRQSIGAIRRWCSVVRHNDLLDVRIDDAEVIDLHEA